MSDFTLRLLDKRFFLVGRVDNLLNGRDKLLKLLALGVASLKSDLLKNLVDCFEVKMCTCHGTDILIRLIVVVDAFEVVHVAVETVRL